MKIADSKMLVSSNRTYGETGVKQKFYSGKMGEVTDAREKDSGDFKRMMVNRRNIRTRSDLQKDMHKVRLSLLSIIIGRLGKDKNKLMSTLTGNSDFGSAFTMQGYTSDISFYEEREDVSFAANGRVLTEDGKTIDFNVELNMSRRFMQYTRTDAPAVASALIDPLVINFDAPSVTLSDQSFRFDLDCDGEEEEISRLASGSGFLALDRNGDGVINDGSELFGTSSGNGFSDLARFDSDGNGWIDENDPVFDRLRIWYKDNNGRDVLVNLKELDVGAIALNAAKTDFSIKDIAGDTNGMLRATSVFLRERGGIGTVSHIDFAARKVGALSRSRNKKIT